MVANGRFAMRPGLTLREDYDAARLRGVARRTKSATQGRRLLALAEIYDGGSRTKAACVGGVGLQTIRGRHDPCWVTGIGLVTTAVGGTAAFSLRFALNPLSRA